MGFESDANDIILFIFSYKFILDPQVIIKKFSLSTHGDMGTHTSGEMQSIGEHRTHILLFTQTDCIFRCLDILISTLIYF